TCALPICTDDTRYHGSLQIMQNFPAGNRIEGWRTECSTHGRCLPPRSCYDLDREPVHEDNDQEYHGESKGMSLCLGPRNKGMLQDQRGCDDKDCGRRV